MTTAPRTLRLIVYQPLILPEDDFPQDMGELLFDRYSSQVTVEFPSYKTGHNWRLTSQSWVGYIPLSDALQIALEPKVPLNNLFQMLDYAYRLDIHFLPDLYQCHSLQDFFDRLASILSKRTMDRGRKGYYREYVSYQEKLPYVREKMNFALRARAPWRVDIDCDFHDHTADIDENQILAWTLYTIARSGLCSDETLGRVRRAYHELAGLVSLRPFQPEECSRRFYNRLNQDYQPLHALSRFFLDQSGPTYQIGERAMIPFFVEMSRLFELFVAEWLAAHLPAPWIVKTQERLPLGGDHGQYFQVDLMLVDSSNGAVKAVLDTKYKSADVPSETDISQVLAYATKASCETALLIYPEKVLHPIDYPIGTVRVRSLGFDIGTDLDPSGHKFLAEILHSANRDLYPRPG